MYIFQQFCDLASKCRSIISKLRSDLISPRCCKLSKTMNNKKVDELESHFKIAVICFQIQTSL